MKASKKTQSKKHTILFYKHSMDRIWRSLLLLTFVMVPIWWFGPPLLNIPQGSFIDYALLGATVISAIGAVLVFFMRNRTYVQAKQDHMLLSTPFLRLKISYRRMKSLRTVEIGRIFQKGNLSWGDKRFLRPYGNLTGLTLVLKDYPISKNILKLFLPNYMLLPEETGFILLVKDWMTLSTEFETMVASFRDDQRQNRKKDEGVRGLFMG